MKVCFILIQERVAVLIAGPCGTGKSYLAQALGHGAVRQGYDVLFTTQTQLLGSLNAARAIATFERRFQTLARVAVLIIDDFGLKPLRTPQDEDFHDLIAERYEPVTSILPNGVMRFPTDSSALPPWIAYAMPRIGSFSKGIPTARLAPWIHQRK